MARLLCLFFLFVLALPAEIASARHTNPKPTCTSGRTLFVDGPLRLLAMPFRTSEESGSEHYACLGRRRGPIAVGGTYSDTGTGFSDVPKYVFAAGRYLGSYNYDDGEGGPSASFRVQDLRDRRAGLRGEVLCCEREAPEMLVAGDGSLVTIQEGMVFLVRPGESRTTQVTTSAAVARDLAVRGATVYWTESGQTTEPAAKSMILDGVPGSDEPRVLTPTTVRRVRTLCERARGRTVAASAKVRVYVPAGAKRRFACRYTRRFRHVAAGDAGEPAPRVVNDRWVLLPGDAKTTVLDTIKRRQVTQVTTPIAELTLLSNGTLAWIDDAARVLAQRPDADTPTELAAGGTALASSRTTVYWTAGGQPQRATP